MKTLIRLAILLVVSMAGAQAAGIDVRTDHNESVDFTALHTFAWLESDIGYAGSRDPVTALKVQRAIHDEVVLQLGKKGFVEVEETDEPDFFVSYHVVVTHEDVPQEKGKLPIIDSSVGTVDSFHIYNKDMLTPDASIRHGTLLLLFIDPETRKVIWQGISEGSATSPAEALKKSRKTLRKMLDEFPPE